MLLGEAILPETILVEPHMLGFIKAYLGEGKHPTPTPTTHPVKFTVQGYQITKRL